jgi:hypothetical protein
MQYECINRGGRGERERTWRGECRLGTRLLYSPAESAQLLPLASEPCLPGASCRRAADRGCRALPPALTHRISAIATFGIRVLPVVHRSHARGSFAPVFPYRTLIVHVAPHLCEMPAHRPQTQKPHHIMPPCRASKAKSSRQPRLHEEQGNQFVYAPPHKLGTSKKTPMQTNSGFETSSRHCHSNIVQQFVAVNL